MSMKRMVSYVCYAVAALALLAVAFLQLPQQADVGLALLFAMAFGAGNTNRVLAKWAQDSEYQKHVMDERNLAIKEKAGNITNMFTTTLLLSLIHISEPTRQAEISYAVFCLKKKKKNTKKN